MKPLHFNRRMMLLGGVALAGLAACGEAKTSEMATDPTLVSTSLGKLRGGRASLSGSKKA
jgi:hypothetical protein